MTKQNLTEEIGFVLATETGIVITKRDLKTILDVTIRLIAESVAEGKTITLREFGTFAPVRRAEKKGRHLQTGEPMIIPAKTVPAFVPADAFVARVSGTHYVAQLFPAE